MFFSNFDIVNVLGLNYIYFELCWNISLDRWIVYGLCCSMLIWIKNCVFVVGMYSWGVVWSNNVKSKKVVLYFIIVWFMLICLKLSFFDIFWSRIKIVILFIVFLFLFVRRNGRDWFVGWLIWIYVVIFFVFLKWFFFF